MIDLQDVFAKTKKIDSLVYDDFDFSTCQFALNIADPTNYHEAVDKRERQQARVEELELIKKNNTWELVNLPTGKNLVGLKW